MDRRHPGRRPLLWGVGLGALGLLAWLALRERGPDPFEAAAQISERARLQFNARAAWLEAREARAAATYWAAEKLAQACGHVFDDLWDALNAASNKLAVAAAFPFETLQLGRWDIPQPGPHGIEIRPSAGPGEVWTPAQWRAQLRAWAGAGWRLEQVEFRHTRFEPDADGRPRGSRYAFSAHLVRPRPPTRCEVVGDLEVDWQPTGDAARPARVRRLDASRLTLKTRAGEVPLFPLLAEEIPPPDRLVPFDPVLLRDLDGDGFPEIALLSVNRLYRRTAEGGYTAGPLCAEPPGPLFTGLVEDFNGDGAPDLLVVNATGLWLYTGAPPAASSPPAPAGPAPPFRHPPRPAWLAETPLKNPMALTCGDVDGDGDLDVFFGQYLVPTLGQVLRPSYHDANDSPPAHLLRNDGTGHFSDCTEAAGLGPKRHRRTYSASLVDLDRDGAPDLVVVSDFAGAEVYRNDGSGRFTEVTAAWLGDAKGFGMAHVLADFNADGLLDLLVIGMPSPTVDRLEHLGLTRPGEAEDLALRRRMASGNRLFLARPEGGFQQALADLPICRSGWSWGAAAGDLDRDGFPDVYIANGHQSTRSVREYEPEFWLHDLYVDDPIEPAVAGAYLFHKFARTRGQGWSYGGYEKNRLYLNRAGTTFLEAAHLFGVALEADSRNVLVEDLDRDGAPELLVTTFEVWPQERQTLRLWHNRLPAGGAWIGFERAGPGETGLPVGTHMRVRAGSRQWAAAVVNGDSHRCQHSGRLHLGLGPVPAVDEVEVRWPHGRRTLLTAPALNRYHRLLPPTTASP